MIIPVNLPIEPTSFSTVTFPPALAQFGSDEMVLIELQGSLEVEGNNVGQTVGKLSVDNTTKKPTLLIGYHLLEGKLVNLPKPIAILHRPPPLESSSANDDCIPDDGEDKTPPTSWDIVAVVKRKMVFAKRPMPMVGKVSDVASVSLGKNIG